MDVRETAATLWDSSFEQALKRMLELRDHVIPPESFERARFELVAGDEEFGPGQHVEIIYFRPETETEKLLRLNNAVAHARHRHRDGGGVYQGW